MSVRDVNPVPRTHGACRRVRLMYRWLAVLDDEERSTPHRRRARRGTDDLLLNVKVDFSWGGERSGGGSRCDEKVQEKSSQT